MMKRYRMLACASALLAIAAVGCAGAPDAVEEAPPAAAEETTAPAAATLGAEEAAEEAEEQAPARRLVSAVRGEAPMVYMRPVVKAAKIGGKDFIVTTMQIKNTSTGAIAGLLVEEFWYNKAGTVVTGDNYRHPKPIQPDEIVTVTLETPRNPAMDSNQLQFQHANGTIKMTLVPKM